MGYAPVSSSMADQSSLPKSLAPIGATRDVAAAYLSLSPTMFGRLVDAGLMPRPRPVGARKIWDLEEVRLAFKALPPEFVPDQEPGEG